MITIQRILCPTNLSLESDEGLRYGVALARAYNAKLFLLYCGEIDQADDQAAPSETIQRMNGLFEEALARHLGLADPEIEWEGIIVKDGRDPADAIVREAKERRIDLIVMRSRRRPRAAALLGSTAEQVYRSAPCPVLITHPQEQEWVSFSTGEIDLTRVLVAHDFSPDSELALDYAVSLAQEYQAELHVMHVLAHPESDGPEVAWGPGSAEGAYHDVARWLQQVTPPEVHLWSKVVHTVRWGKPYHEVLTYAREQQIDLICMGAKGKGKRFGSLFGSNVDRVLRQAPCPVFVARPLEPGVFAPLDVRTDLGISREQIENR